MPLFPAQSISNIFYRMPPLPAVAGGKTGRNARTLEDAHGHFVTSVAMHKNGTIVVSGGVDKNLHVWECR
ncbi:unnamed protein product [Discosporangium mesarthrocarpum]